MMMSVPVVDGFKTTYVFRPEYVIADWTTMQNLLDDATMMGCAALGLIDDREVRVVITSAALRVSTE